MRKAPFSVLAVLGLAAAAAAQPLDLAGCVRRALAKNPQVLDALDASVAAALGRELSFAEYRFKAVPTIDGGVQGGNRRNQSYDLLFQRKLLATGTEIDLRGGTNVYSGVPQVAIPYFSEARVTVAQPLLQGRSRLESRERIDAASRGLASAEHALERTREDLALQVVRAFYDVVRAAELEAAAESSRTRVGELVQVARAKLSLGSVSKMDVFRAELNASRIENAAVAERARRAAGEDALKMLLGVDPAVPLELDLGMQGPAPTDLGAADAEATALERRIEVVEAREEAADAERRLLLARYKIWPALDLVGFYAKQGPGVSFDDSLRFGRTEWSIGIRSTTTLDRTEEEIAAAAAEIALRSRERRYRQARAEVVRQVRDALREVERARAALKLAGEIADQADKQAELARFRYDKGVTDNLDLVQSEVQRLEAESGRVLAAIDEALAAAAVRRATGTLVDAFGGSAAPAPAPSPPAAAAPPGIRLRSSDPFPAAAGAMYSPRAVGGSGEGD